MKNILLISNVSADNEQLIEFAAKFCKYYECVLHILHFSPLSAPILVSTSKYYKDFNIKHDNENKKKLTQAIMKITAEILDRSFIQIEIQKGNEDKILKSFISEHFIDLILLGNMDLNKKSELPNHKNMLMNMINTPLLAIPEYHSFKPLEKFNFLTTHTKADLKHITQLAALFPKSSITLTHFLTKAISAVEKIKTDKWVDYVTEKTSTKIKYEKLQLSLKQYIQNQNFVTSKKYDALVFSSHKRNFWSRLIDPSTTLSFLSMIEIPTLVFKIEETSS